jgi:hypothetical protein
MPSDKELKVYLQAFYRLGTFSALFGPGVFAAPLLDVTEKHGKAVPWPAAESHYQSGGPENIELDFLAALHTYLVYQRGILRQLGNEGEDMGDRLGDRPTVANMLVY